MTSKPNSIDDVLKCDDCRRLLPTSYFNPFKNAKTKYRPWCKQCGIHRLIKYNDARGKPRKYPKMKYRPSMVDHNKIILHEAILSIDSQNNSGHDNCFIQGFAYRISKDISYTFQLIIEDDGRYGFYLYNDLETGSIEFNYSSIDTSDLFLAVGSHLDAMDVRIDVDELVHLEVKRMVYFK